MGSDRRFIQNHQESLPVSCDVMYRNTLTGNAAEEILAPDGRPKIAGDCSADGRFLLAADDDLWAFPLKGDLKPLKVLTADSFRGRYVRFSADGNFIAYESDITGRSEIYVLPFGKKGGPWQVSSTGGTDPKWRNDGKELFYIGRDQSMMSVPIRMSGDEQVIEHGAPTALFKNSMG